MKTHIAIVMIACTACTMGAQAQESDQAAELAKKLANPVAALISVPLQYNYDEKYGVNDDGHKHVLNVQPVIPFSLGDDWTLVLRTIVPLISETNVPSGTEESGLGDIVQSFFFSPKEPIGGWIVAVGPVGLYPSATDSLLGGEKWGAGPTALALTQTGPWTIGFLGNHLESFAGDDQRDDLSLTFLQPFVAFITKTKTTFALNTESTYDWNNEQWSVPLNMSVSQLLKISSQILQLSVGVRYWAESPDAGPEGFGLRAGVTFLFPK